MKIAQAWNFDKETNIRL